MRAERKKFMLLQIILQLVSWLPTVGELNTWLLFTVRKLNTLLIEQLIPCLTPSSF